MKDRMLVHEIRKNFKVGRHGKLVGRVIARRAVGKIIFLVLRDQSGSIQLICSNDTCGEELFPVIKTIGEGDIISAEGEAVFSRTNEESLLIKNCDILRKCQRADFIGSRKNKGDKYGEKFIELSVDQNKFEYYANCSQIVFQIRKSLYDRGFLEFNTGILHSRFEGGLAQPFETHLKTSSRKLYLRPALEIRLKQLLAGGYEKVFEIGNVFRNKNCSPRTSPEFVLLECYKAFSTYDDMANLLEAIIKEAILKVYGESSICMPETVKNILKPWRRVSFEQILNETDERIGSFQGESELKRILLMYELTGTDLTEGQMVKRILEKIVTPRITSPTYITEIPLTAFTFTKANDKNKEVSEGAILVINGKSIAECCTDENDYGIIENRLIEQSKQSGRPINDSFVDLLKFGLPPSAGFGLGINRLLYILRDDKEKDFRETFVLPPLE